MSPREHAIDDAELYETIVELQLLSASEVEQELAAWRDWPDTFENWQEILDGG